MKLVILGAGPGGYGAAARAARLGAEVTVIEKSQVGGTCLNWGCIPTKSIAASAAAYDRAKRLSDFGILLKGDLTPDMRQIIERKNRVVSTQIKGIHAFFKSKGIKIIEGRGKILSPDRLSVELADGSRQELHADKIIIATGSRPAALPGMEYDGEKILSSDHAVNMEFIPDSMAIIGAGVIGSEFACIFRQLGAEVTMIEMMPRALMTEDEEISGIFMRELKKMKIRLITGAKTEKITKNDNTVSLELSSGDSLTVQKVLVSIGRALNTADIGLENTDIKPTPKGVIHVDEHLRTASDNIYAVGDITGKMMLAHLATRQGVIAAENACGLNPAISYTCVPAGVFTSPEIGSAGLREEEAKERGLDIKVGRFQYRTLGKAHADGNITGLIKIISDVHTDKVLGMHIIGAHAADLVHEGALAINAGLKTSDIADTIHAHPTLAEGIMEAASDIASQ
ncbi:MAG: dihydrolipoyl dehydrogenase [Dissulfurispiraceae bacterium]|jgi:dihydrolipoamide dehydrogenase|nr:dihydrolipoyl dehydrogenase [Dissulfurispiraceae bacterium]